MNVRLSDCPQTSAMAHVSVDWSLIALPIVSVFVLIIVFLLIWRFVKNKSDVQRSPDGLYYRILDV